MLLAIKPSGHVSISINSITNPHFHVFIRIELRSDHALHIFDTDDDNEEDKIGVVTFAYNSKIETFNPSALTLIRPYYGFSVRTPPFELSVETLRSLPFIHHMTSPHRSSSPHLVHLLRLCLQRVRLSSTIAHQLRRETPGRPSLVTPSSSRGPPSVSNAHVLP